MAYIVLVAGALMALFGVMAVITGYPIIQVERGWATFIAGSSLMAGGLVTIALGFVLRAMVDLKNALSGKSLSGVARPVEPPIAAADILSHPIKPALVGASMVAVPAAALAIEEKSEPSDTSHSASEAAPLPDWIDQAPVSPITIPEPELPAAHQVPVEPDGFRSPPIDDWLDRAFADIAHHPEPLATPRAEPALIADGDTMYVDQSRHTEKAVAAEPAFPATKPGVVTLESHDAATEHQKPAAETPAASPALHPETEAAVIGRYEADGTFYTMYADGSIEAQSDAGLYRFASMAELKAFIES